MTTFATILAAPAAGRRRPAAGHVLRRRHRRAHRAVGDDVRQLGREDRLAAGRGARPRARPDAPDRPADALARPGLPRRRVDGRAGRDARTTTADAVVCGPGRAAIAGPTEPPTLPVLACALHPLGRPVRGARCRPACTTSASRSGRSPTRSSPFDPPGPDDLARGRRPPRRELWDAAAAGSLLTDGGRLLTEANPASPPGLASFTEPLATRRLAGPGRPRRTRSGSRRRTPPSAPRPASLERLTAPSAGQVVALHPLGQEPPRPRSRSRCAGSSVEVAGRLLPDDQVGVAGEADVADADHPVVRRRGRGRAPCGSVSPPGPLPR